MITLVPIELYFYVCFYVYKCVRLKKVLKLCDKTYTCKHQELKHRISGQYRDYTLKAQAPVVIKS